MQTPRRDGGSHGGREDGLNTQPLVSDTQSYVAPFFVSSDYGGELIASSAPPEVSQAEVAVRRLKARVNISLWENGRSGVGDQHDRGRRVNGGKRAAAAVALRGELRKTQGRLAEVSHLLEATENERDSLGAVLVLTERRMEHMAGTQEELALKLAWENAFARHQLQHEERPPVSSADGNDGVGEKNVGTIGVGKEAFLTTWSTTTQQLLESVKGNPSPARATSTAQLPRDTIAAASACKVEIENLELRRRVRDLEILQKSVEAEAREIQKENRQLKKCWSSVSWGENSGDTTTEKEEQRRARQNGGSTKIMQTGGSEGEEQYNNDRQSQRTVQKYESKSNRSQCDATDSSLPLDGTTSTEGKRVGGEIKGGRARRNMAKGLFGEIVQLAGLRSGTPRPEDQNQANSPLLELEADQLSPSSPPNHQKEKRQRQQEKRTVGLPENDRDSLIKAKLAWVLGVPVKTTTEHELLAEVMHLVVQRGTVTTDTTALGAQLAQMDEQLMCLTQPDASTTAPTHYAHRNHQRDPSVTGDGGGGASGGFVFDGGRGVPPEQSLISPLLGNDGSVGSVSNKMTEITPSQHGSVGGCGDGGVGEATGYRPGVAERTAKGAPAASLTAGEAGETWSGRGGSIDLQKPGEEYFTGTTLGSHSSDINGPVVMSSSRFTASEVSSDEKEAATKVALELWSRGTARGVSVADVNQIQGTAVVSKHGGLVANTKDTPNVAAALPSLTKGTTVPSEQSSGLGDEEPPRTSFPKHLQGRMVYIDIICTKVMDVK